MRDSSCAVQRCFPSSIHLPPMRTAFHSNARNTVPQHGDFTRRLAHVAIGAARKTRTALMGSLLLGAGEGSLSSAVRWRLVAAIVEPEGSLPFRSAQIKTAHSGRFDLERVKGSCRALACRERTIPRFA